jgi:23S rRNA (uracil1939-C5)-methyltransferase
VKGVNKIEVTIEKLVYGGDGLARQSGTTVFVPYVLPQERVLAEPIECKKNFVRARVGELLSRSPERIAAHCPHFRDCGGCHYQHISYEKQLVYKSEILRETLRRIGKIDWREQIPVHPSPEWGYRNRAQWKIRRLESSSSDTCQASESNAHGASLGIGYFRPNSAALCAVKECAVLAPPLLRALVGLRDALSAGALPASLLEIEAFAYTAERSADWKLSLTCSFMGFPCRREECVEAFRKAVPGTTSLVLYDVPGDRMALDGQGYIDHEANGAWFRVGHFSFFQVNRYLAGELARAVTQTGTGSGRLALDLYAGVGLFAVPLARKFERVVAVEANPAAARDLEANVRRAGTIQARQGEADHFLSRFKDKPDLVVVDPPRSGLTSGLIERLSKIAPRNITYVSCEPPTLARDLAPFLRAGYALKSLDLFDLFPQTFHIETVAQLEKA